MFKNWPVPLGAQVIINATVSVDSFFLISAALFSYLYIAKKTSPRQSFIVVAFRYLRLTVCFALIGDYSDVGDGTPTSGTNIDVAPRLKTSSNFFLAIICHDNIFLCISSSSYW